MGNKPRTKGNNNYRFKDNTGDRYKVNSMGSKGKSNKTLKTDDGSGFLNPYNFIDINLNNSGQKTDAADNADNTGGNLTGVLKCKLKTKTKLFIPESEPINPSPNEDHKKYPFMTNGNGEYIIPGSSLRGVIRSVYETATDSCFSTLTNSKLLSSRFDGGNMRPGLLKREGTGKWVLYEAEVKYVLTVIKDDNKIRDWEGSDRDYRVEGWDYKNGKVIKNGRIIAGNGLVFSTGERVTIEKKEPRKCKGFSVDVFKKLESYKTGDSNEDYIFVGEDFKNKHYSRVFRKTKKLREISRKELQGLINIYKDYGDNKINKNHYSKSEKNNHHGYDYLKISQHEDDFEKDIKVIPLWYERAERDDYFYLQLAAKGRRTYNKQLNDFVDEVHKPCENRKKLCAACMLFGMVGKTQNTEAIGSRIRFTDAVTTTPEKFTDRKDPKKWRTLEILSTPHVYLPFFAENNIKDEVVKNGDYDKIANLKGRKFYLHATKEMFEKINHAGVHKSNQNITAQITNEDTEFEFDVFFDNISELELRKLIWSLNFWENDINGNYCHKIGHGKPIGMGSSKIIIDNIIFREYKSGYSEQIISFNEFISDKSNPFNESENSITYCLKRLCDYSAVNSPVHYPGWKENAKDDDKGFQWFSKNKSAAAETNDGKMQRLKKFGEKNDKLYDWIDT